MYEWGQVGNSQGRLFDLVIPPESRGRANFSMKVNFRQSKKLVPLTEAQSTPGPTGQVVKKAHRFFNKAMVMEYGQTVHIRPLGDRAMAFDNNADGAKWGNSFSARDGLIFSRGTVVIDYSNRPTYHGFQTALKTFFSTHLENSDHNFKLEWPGIDGEISSLASFNSFNAALNSSSVL